MFFTAYAFKGQVHVIAGQAKFVSHSLCRTSTIMKLSPASPFAVEHLDHLEVPVHPLVS